MGLLHKKMMSIAKYVRSEQREEAEIALKTFALFYMTSSFIRKETKHGRHGMAAACRFLFHFYMVQISVG